MRHSGGMPEFRSTMPLLQGNRATHCVNNTAKFDDGAVPGALYNSAVILGNCRID
jgi:hypothetical protein